MGLGFTGASENDSDAQYERMKAKVNDELKKHFRPEFLNRIDDVVVFHQLTREQIVQMVNLLIDRVGTQLEERDMGIELTDKAQNLLAQRGFDPVLGARPLRRTIQRDIEDQLSEKILFGEIGAGEIISVDVEGWDGESKDDSGATFTFTPRPKPLPDDIDEPSLADASVRDNNPSDEAADGSASDNSDSDSDGDNGDGNGGPEGDDPKDGGPKDGGSGSSNDGIDTNGEPDVISPDVPSEKPGLGNSDDDGKNPPPAGAGQPM